MAVSPPLCSLLQAFLLSATPEGGEKAQLVIILSCILLGLVIILLVVLQLAAIRRRPRRKRPFTPTEKLPLERGGNLDLWVESGRRVSPEDSWDEDDEDD